MDRSHLGVRWNVKGFLVHGIHPRQPMTHVLSVEHIIVDCSSVWDELLALQLEAFWPRVSQVQSKYKLAKKFVKLLSAVSYNRL